MKVGTPLLRKTVWSRLIAVSEWKSSSLLEEMVSRAGGWNGCATSDTKETPLHLLGSMFGHRLPKKMCVSIIEKAFSENADCSTRDVWGRTPLATALMNSPHQEMFVSCMADHSDGKEVDWSGANLLHLSVYFNAWNSVGKRLFEYLTKKFGLDMKSVDGNGKTLADIAMFVNSPAAWIFFVNEGISFSGMSKSESYEGIRTVVSSAFSPSTAIRNLSKGFDEMLSSGLSPQVLLDALPQQDPWQVALAVRRMSMDFRFDQRIVPFLDALSETVIGKVSESGRSAREILMGMMSEMRDEIAGERALAVKSKIESIALSSRRVHGILSSRSRKSPVHVA